ncbi:MAG TPA: Ku protein, partial [Nevskiaceae bacterium]|nr:Ku protein [Nevskiaceae bacterium]
MPRAIWKGSISFGLLNIPVELMSAESRVDLHFRLLDQRNKARVRYERVNEETGDEVPWDQVVKAFEYHKGSYVVVEEEDFKRAAPEIAETVAIEAFVDPADISLRYYERPYFLVPPKKAEKGYVLLRETLVKQKRVGLARVVIRTREYLSLVVPEGPAMVLHLIRYPQELVDADQYAFPDRAMKDYRITPKEREMAEQLVEAMASPWKPAGYRDEFREKLTKAIEARVKKKGATKRAKPEAAPAAESGK